MARKQRQTGRQSSLLEQSVEPRYLSSADAATYLGVTEQALRKWRERGLIPFIKVGRRVFFDRYELDAHMADNRVEAWAS